MLLLTHMHPHSGIIVSVCSNQIISITRFALVDFSIYAGVRAVYVVHLQFQYHDLFMEVVRGRPQHSGSTLDYWLTDRPLDPHQGNNS